MQIRKEAPSAVEAAMELTAVMAVSQIAQQEKKPETEVLKSFMNSNTAKMLFDDETKLLHNGPAYVAYEYLKECERKKKQLKCIILSKNVFHSSKGRKALFLLVKTHD